MPDPVRLLIVEDREEHAELVTAVLRSAGIPADARRVETAAEMERELARPVDLVILDCELPRFSGPEAIRLLRRRGLDVPCVVVSGTVGEETAVEMMRAGAADYVMKGNLARLPAVVERELREAGERAARRSAEAAGAALSERLGGLLRAAGALAVIGAGADGTITDFSEGAERMLGYPAAEVLGRERLWFAGDPDELAARAAALGAASALDALLTSSRGEGGEWTWRRRDGSSLPVSLSVAPVTHGAGQVTGYVAIARDITRRRRREEEQRALGRVATTVAAGPEPGEVFAFVAREAATLLRADAAGVARFAAEQAVQAGTWRREGASGLETGAGAPLGDDGVLAAVRREGRCRRAEGADAARDPAWNGAPAPRDVLACPIAVHGRRWGALWVAATGRRFDDEDLGRLARFADLVGLAIANAESRDRVVSTTLARIFRGDGDLGRTLEAIVEAAREALDADRVTCFVHNERGDAVVQVHTTETDPARRAYLDAATGLSRREMPIWQLLVAEPSPVMVVEGPADQTAVPSGVRGRLGAEAFVGLRLEHPSLMSEGRRVLLGSLFVSYRAPRRFTAHELTAAESLAAMASVALANARLHAASARSAAEAAATVTDPLTGLANHRAFHERLAGDVARARARGTPLSLALIDIDRFRRINEEHGHQAGDEVLAVLARRLDGMARSGDLVARVGGEELAWLMPGTDAMAAWQAVERAREAVGRTDVPRVGRVTVSAGVCDLDQAGSARDLVRLAEGALYWAKQHGRDVAFLYSPEVVEVLSAEEKAERLARFQALQSIKVLARAVDARDPSTREHSERVAEVSVALATELGWEVERLLRLHEAGLVHDVGKIGVPDAILFKPERLTPAEYAEITRHAEIGASIVTDAVSAEQAAWVRGHHERWDGRGYPDGLSADEIPDGAAVLALADAWDVMTSERPYHDPLSKEDALAEVRRCAGSQFAPGLVDALHRLVRQGRLSANGRVH